MKHGKAGKQAREGDKMMHGYATKPQCRVDVTSAGVSLLGELIQN